MEFEERLKSWKHAIKWKGLFWLLLLVPAHLVRDLLQDRLIGGLNGYIDRHSNIILAMLARIGRFLLLHPVSSTAVFVILVFAILMVHAYMETRPTGQQKVDTKNGNLDLRLTPSSGPSDKMLLAIMNNSNAQKFHAQCTVLARRNDPNRLFQKTYDLPWEDHKYRHATIVRGESRNLLVARADEDRQSETEEVSLIERQAGGDKRTVEWSRWDRSKAGPEYDVEVSVFGEGDAEPYKERFTLRCGGKACALEMVKLEENKEAFPERGDFYRSTSSSRDNPDGSFTLEARISRQIDCRPQMWESLAARFKQLAREPMPIWAEWIYTNETKHYEWWIRHPSEVDVKMCLELCKEAGRLLKAEPKFKARFPDVSAVLDEGDRWLLAIYKVARIGKLRAEGSSVNRGVVTTHQGGEIKDVPGASQVLCQMARNGF